ncbi:MAG: translocation/assembly module TamB domain-containing protein [Aphanocapsa lilacina HA4352-LM1]|nr:translocation/assembly module TamB domain-containing protein [Aphanocapsa lilacina HA4352-LM1]
MKFRRLLFVGSALLLLVVVLGWLGTLWLGPAALAQAEVQLSRTLQTPVRLGRLQTLLPWRIAVGPVSVASSKQPDLLEAPSASVGFNLLRFAFGQGLDARIRFEKPVLRLRRDAQGRFNLPPFAASENQSGGTIDKLLSRVEIDDATFVYDDRVLGGKSLTLTGIDVLADIGPTGAAYTLNAPFGRGEVQAEGNSDLDDFDTTIDARLRNIPVATAAVPLNLGDLSVRRGTAEGSVQLQLKNGVFAASGPLRLTGGELLLRPYRAPLTNLDVAAKLAWPKLNLERIEGRLAGSRVSGTGAFNLPEELGLDLIVAGPLEQLVPALTSPPVPVRGVTRTALQARIPLARPDRLTATARVRAQTPVQVDRLLVNNLQTEQRLANLRLSGPFRFEIARGQVTGRTDLNFAPGVQAQVNIAADGQAVVPEEILARYDAQLPVERVGRLDFQARIAGPANRLLARADFNQRDGRLQGKAFSSTGTVVLAGSELFVENTRVQLDGTAAQLLASGQANLVGRRLFGAQLSVAAVPLSLVSPALGGTAEGQVAVNGSLQSLASLEGTGTFTVPRPLVNNRLLPPVATAFRLREQLVRLDRFTFNGLTVDGTLQPNLSGAPGPLLRSANLRIALDRFDLTALPLPVRVDGQLYGTGSFTGNLEQPDLTLDLRVRGAGVGRYRAPVLSGPVRWRGDTLSARLTGDNQRVFAEARLEPQGVRLIAFDVLSDRTRLAASRGYFDFEQGLTTLAAQVKNFDLERLQLDPVGPLRTVEGSLDAEVDLARTARGYEGRVDATLSGGRLNAFTLGSTRLRASLANNRLTVEPTLITLGNSRYTLGGQAGLGADDPIAFELRVERGRLEQAVQLLGLYSLTTLFSDQSDPVCCAVDLGPLALGGTALPLQQLLAVYQRASEVTLARIDTTARAFIPDDLRRLRGRYDLSARLGGSRNAPVVGFVLAGRNWQWDQYRLDTVEAAGDYRDGNLELTQAQARYAERSGSLSGRLSLAGEQNARLVIDRLPLELVEPLLPTGTQIEGDINTEAVLTGTLASPAFQANVAAAALEFNGRQVDPVRTELTLRSGRLSLANTAIGVGRRGVQLVGSLPIPFLNPDNDQIDIRAQLTGENLPLLNILSDQLVWQSAEGEATLAVQGTYGAPLIDGNVELRNTQVQIPRLQTTLAIDQFAARFNRRRLLVDRLAANLGGAPVTGEGKLALLPNNGAGGDLALFIDGNINLPGLYRGGIDGQLSVGGALLGPRIGGNLTVSPGDLLLSLQDIQNLSGAGLRTANSNGAPALPVEFDELRIRVGPQFRVNITALSARLDGLLALSGPLGKLAVEGYINVPQGSVTIGVARFRLDSSRRNALYFGGSLDPALDLVAEARVSESFTSGVARLDSGGLINPSLPSDQANLGRASKIDVEATVTGTASKPDVELTSSPYRDETEIIALIGGGGNAGSLLTGLIPAVGTTLIRPVEQELASLLGLDELRVEFASRVANASPENIAIGIGVEAIKDLTPAVSVSLFKNITDNIQPVIFGLRYRINDNIVTRVSGNETLDDVSLSVQFESRF